MQRSDQNQRNLKQVHAIKRLWPATSVIKVDLGRDEPLLLISRRPNGPK